MAKLKVSNAVRQRKFILEFEKDTFSIDGLTLLCKLCGVKIAFEKKFTLQHIACFNIKILSCHILI